MLKSTRSAATPLREKSVDIGRGSFTPPGLVEGDVTPEGLHNSFLSIAPFVASKMVNVQHFGELTAEQMDDSEALMASIDELRVYFNVKQRKPTVHGTHRASVDSAATLRDSSSSRV